VLWIWVYVLKALYLVQTDIEIPRGKHGETVKSRGEIVSSCISTMFDSEDG
jgi:hypothetical protein